jgi:Acyl-CoA reductase (LuxC)
MQIQERINAFVELGKFLGELSNENETDQWVIEKAFHHNAWFTPQNIERSLRSWHLALTEYNLVRWTSAYSFSDQPSKSIAIIMAGNIPLVGFHDFITVLISGHKVLTKLSSNDKILLPFIAEKLIEIEPRFRNLIEFSETKLAQFDAVIATGSNNTSLYFEHYFGKYPNIIRKNRNSVAVLTGNETPKQLEALADDIFSYFGLGCRNISKIYLPKGSSFDAFFQGMYSWKEIINNHKYINNYDYNKAVYLMSNIPILDNEFMLLKEDSGFSSPISVVFYEFYEDMDSLTESLRQQKENIQCVASYINFENEVRFGATQSPELWDYADGKDTLSFLLHL